MPDTQQPLSAKEAHTAILAYLQPKNPASKEWCVGVTSNLETRLHGDGGHNMPYNNWHVSRQCLTNADARSVANLLVKDGCESGGIDEDQDSLYVYAYLKCPGASRP